MARIRHAPLVPRVSTISSAPTELTAFPRYSPCDTLVDDAHAVLPSITTCTGEMTLFTARAYAMSAGK